MTGSGKRYIQRIVDEALRAQNKQLHILNTNDDSGSYVRFGCLNADKTKITLDDGTQVDAVVIGVPTTCGPCYKINDNTYAMKGPKPKFIQTDGGEKAYILLTADWLTYYIKRAAGGLTEDNEDPSPNLYQVPTDLVPEPTYVFWPSTQFPYDAKLDEENGYRESLKDGTNKFLPSTIVRFSLDGKHLAIVNMTCQDNDQTVLNWAILKNFSLNNDTMTVTASDENITTGSKILDPLWPALQNNLCNSWFFGSTINPPNYNKLSWANRLKFHNILHTRDTVGDVTGSFTDETGATCSLSDHVEEHQTNTVTLGGDGREKVFVTHLDISLRTSSDGDPLLDIVGNYVEAQLYEIEVHTLGSRTVNYESGPVPAYSSTCNCSSELLQTTKINTPAANWKCSIFNSPGSISINTLINTNVCEETDSAGATRDSCTTRICGDMSFTQTITETFFCDGDNPDGFALEGGRLLTDFKFFRLENINNDSLFNVETESYNEISESEAGNGGRFLATKGIFETKVSTDNTQRVAVIAQNLFDKDGETRYYWLHDDLNGSGDDNEEPYIVYDTQRSSVDGAFGSSTIIGDSIKAYKDGSYYTLTGGDSPLTEIQIRKYSFNTETGEVSSAGIFRGVHPDSEDLVIGDFTVART